MNKLYVFLMMFAALMLAVPAFAGQAASSMETATEMAPTSKKEMKAQKKALRKAVRKATVKSIFNKNKEEGAKPAADVLAIILAIFLPPVGVWYYQGEITVDFWISLALTFLLGIPGIVYALLVVLDVFSAA